MADVYDNFDWPYTVTLRRRTAGGYAGTDGKFVAPTTTEVAITGHIIIGPYEEHHRTADHILSGRAKQVGLVVERGRAVMWTAADARKGDEVIVNMDADGDVKQTYLVVDELDRPKLIEKLTGLRPGRRKLDMKLEAPR